METIILAAVMGIMYWITKTEIGYNLGFIFCNRPIVYGFVAGFLTGDIKTGLIVGGTIQLIYIGVIAPGGNFPSDAALSGATVVPIALMTNMDPAVAVTLAVPVGLLGVFLINLRKTVMIRVVASADKYAEDANVNGIFKCAVIYPMLMNVFFAFLPVFLTVIFGTSLVETVLQFIPEAIMNGLAIAGGMLPALGFGLIMHMIGKDYYLPFMIIGFFLAQLTGSSSLILGIIGGCIAFAIVALKRQIVEEVE